MTTVVTGNQGIGVISFVNVTPFKSRTWFEISQRDLRYPSQKHFSPFILFSFYEPGLQKNLYYSPVDNIYILI